MLAFKLFRGDLYYQYGDITKRYPINQWTRRVTPILCQSGYHVSSSFSDLISHLRSGDINRLFIVDCKGKRDLDEEDDNKVSFESIKLVKEIDVSQKNLNELSYLISYNCRPWNTQAANLSYLLENVQNCESSREIVRKFFKIPKSLFYKDIFMTISKERNRKKRRKK